MNENKKSIDIFTTIDLEMNQPSRKIIQVGVVVGNIRTGNIITEYSAFINPQEELNPYIIDLTGITQADVDSGKTLEEVYKEISAIHKHFGSFINPITWGGGDAEELKDQLVTQNSGWPTDLEWCFGRRWIDTKTLFVSWRLAQEQPIQGGLSRCMLKLGLKFDGRKHNAMHDARNTFRMYCAMLKKMRA